MIIEYDLDKTKGILRLKIPGDISSTNHDEVSKEIDRILANPLVDMAGWNSLVLDLVSARMIDSMGLNVVVNLIRRAKARNGTIKSIISSRTIYRTYLFTRLEKQMDVEFIEPQNKTGSASLS